MVGAPDLKMLASDLEKAGTPWVMDEMISMARMTETERVTQLGFHPPAGAMSREQAVQADKVAPAITADVIAAEGGFGAPAAFDHRNVNGKTFTTPVNQQGGCGSCMAHGVAAVMATTYRRSINNPNYDRDLSEAHLFYCHGGEEGRNCQNGWFPDAALDKTRTKGVTLDSVYPCTGSQ